MKSPFVKHFFWAFLPKKRETFRAENPPGKCVFWRFYALQLHIQPSNHRGAAGAQALGVGVFRVHPAAGALHALGLGDADGQRGEVEKDADNDERQTNLEEEMENQQEDKQGSDMKEAKVIATVGNYLEFLDYVETFDKPVLLIMNLFLLNL